jgi:hypothetical protein
VAGAAVLRRLALVEAHEHMVFVEGHLIAKPKTLIETQEEACRSRLPNSIL